MLPKKKISFLGCPLDAEESDHSLKEKMSSMGKEQINPDPYEVILSTIDKQVSNELWESRGNIDVPTWLQPFPLYSDRQLIKQENFIEFIDGNGCKVYADIVEAIISSEILPATPCLIGIEHSISGGAIKACADYYGRNNISVVVFDSHTDAIPLPIMENLIQHDIETNPESIYNRDNPYIKDRADTYNTASFIMYLIDERIIDPEKLYVIGVGDYPEKTVAAVNDKRVQDYFKHFQYLKSMGVQFITKKELQEDNSRAVELLAQIETPNLYVSVDIDIGSANALIGCRYINRRGLDEHQIYYLAYLVKCILQGDKNLAGLDVMEINPRYAGAYLENFGQDRTYNIAANLIKLMAFGIDS